MTTVYGRSIEPGGMELDDYYVIKECKNCGNDCRYRIFEDCVSGAINQRFSYTCNHCGYHSCNADVCDVCESIDHEEHTERYRSSIFLELDGLVELMKIEGDILAIRTKINLGIHEHSDIQKLNECLHSVIYPGFYERRNTNLYKEVSDIADELATATLKRLERLFS